MRRSRGSATWRVGSWIAVWSAALAATAATAAEIEGVEIAEGAAPVVRIRATAPIAPVVSRLRAAGSVPERVVVDLPDATLAPAAARVLAGRGCVARVRAGQFAANTARVVIELAGPARHTVEVQAATVTLRLDPPEAAPAGGPGTEASVVAATAVATTPVPVPVAPAPVSLAAVASEAAVDAAPFPAFTPPPPPIDPAVSPFRALGGRARILWPALDGPGYDEPFAAPLRDALARWRAEGSLPPPPPQHPGSPAATLLAADVQLLRAAAGADEPLAALAAYEAAARQTGGHPEAARAAFMQAAVAEWLGMGPEASAGYTRVLERFPDHPLAPWARLGAASALRLRRRQREARVAVDAVLATATGALRCAALRERGRVERAAGEVAAAAGTLREAALRCPELVAEPGMLHEVAETLAAGGAREEAVRILRAQRAPRAPDEEAALDLLAGDLAYATGDREGARAAWERTLGRKVVLATRLDAERRLATIEPDTRRGVERLVALADEPAPPGTRAAMLAEAADAKARAGALDEAFALLDRAARLGPEGAARADARRAALLGQTVARLRAAEDWSGLVTLYAAQTTAIRQLAGPEARRAIADALGRLGLDAAGVDLLAPLGVAGDREARLAVAEGALAAGDPASARAALAGFDAGTPPPALAPRVARARARLALADGDPGAAAAALAPYPDATLAPALARAWLAKGDAAAAAGSWDEAARAWSHALAASDDALARRGAALGLARAALARGDGAAAASALDEAARHGGPLVRRAAAALLTASALGGTLPAEDHHGP